MPGPSIEVAFGHYEGNLQGAADYVGAVTPVVVKNPKTLRVFVEGSIVLLVAYVEDFLRSLVGMAAHHREPALRKLLSGLGNDAERTRSQTCDRVELVRMAKNRLSFKKDGAAITRIFDALFACPAWPSNEVRDVMLDLVLVRNMIVHSGSAEVGIDGEGEYAKQLRQADVFTVREIGNWKTYHVDPMKALLVYSAALPAFQAHGEYLKDRLVRDDSWMRLP